MRIRLLAAATVLTLAASAGCSDAEKTPAQPPAPSADGPVSAGTEHVDLCMPMPVTSHDATFGNTVLLNSGSTDATITGVSAVDPQGLRISEVSIVVLNDMLFGSSTAYPPRSIKFPGKTAQWQTRRPAAGHQVGPAKDGTNYNLIAHVLKDDGTSEASLRAMRVDYTVDGQAYSTETTFSYTLKPRCS
jgi:hypothetical protein